MDNNEEKLMDEAEYGEQVRIRREKLKNLVAEGKNPFARTKIRAHCRFCCDYGGLCRVRG